MVEACSSDGMWISADDWEGVVSAAAFLLERSFFLALPLDFAVECLNRKQTMGVHNKALGYITLAQ
jgi:hypothetical protein